MKDDNSNDKWKKFSEEQTNEDQEKRLEEEPQAKIEYTERQALENQLTAMEQKLDEAKFALDEYKEKNLRLLAQFKNIQERADRDVEKAHKYGSEKLISDLLPVVDSLVRGLEIVSNDPNQSVYEGMKLTLDLLHNVLTKHGVQIIDPAPGEPFNPEFQEAMSMQKASGAEPNTILQVLQRGYSLNGRVLRAAMVIVAS